MNFDDIGTDIADLVKNNKRLAAKATVQVDYHRRPDLAEYAARQKVAANFTEKLLEEKKFFSTKFDKVTWLLHITADCVVMTKEELREFYEKAFSAGLRETRSFSFEALNAQNGG